MPLDDLTRIYNRRELFSRLRQELARSRRSYIPFSVVMIDADHFKDVNDNYGHLRGDRVLVEIAQIIKNTCREMDIPCRYGGDEFAVIMPNTDSKAVIAASNRLLDKIRHHIFTGNEQPDLRITASIGAATYSDEINNADELIAKADQALYAAKKKGRNQCCDVTQINGRDTAPKLNFSRFVNRDNELSTLKETFMNTFDHQGRFTVVEGVAGIGKTRLINEFGSFIQLHDALLLASRPFEFGTTPPYHIFMQLIKQFIESKID